MPAFADLVATADGRIARPPNLLNRCPVFHPEPPVIAPEPAPNGVLGATDLSGDLVQRLGVSAAFPSMPLEPRPKLSPLAAFWYTEIGPLNHLIHVWPYENTLERSKIRADAIQRGVWPPKTSKFIAEMKSEIF